MKKWEIVNARDFGSTDSVKFGDSVALYSVHRGTYLSADTSSRVLQKDEPASREEWEIIARSAPGSVSGALSAWDKTAFRSKYWNTFLLEADGSPQHGGHEGEWKIIPKEYLRNWMAIETKIHDKKLKEITLPGSHDAVTFDLQNELSDDTGVPTGLKILAELDLVNLLKPSIDKIPTKLVRDEINNFYDASFFFEINITETAIMIRLKQPITIKKRVP